MTDAPAIIIAGDSERCAEMRHEVPIAIGDPFLLVAAGGTTTILTNALERDRLAAAVPGAELVLLTDLGFFDLLEAGTPRAEAELETISRAVAATGVARAAVPGTFPVAVADRLRADGVTLDVDQGLFDARRRAKSPAELAGIRRAQVAAEAGLAAAAGLLRAAAIEGDGLVLDGEPLTAERVRAAIRDACAAHGAPATPDVMVTSAWSGGGHDSGTGPLPANMPIEVDLWPRDEESGCWADTTRTFLVGEPSAEVAALHEAVVEALAAARALVRPGANCRDVYDAAAAVIEAAGQPTLRTRAPGETLERGFYFSLGHGIGLDVHEAPIVGLSAEHTLVEGDVIALEPGVEDPAFGGVRVEDLVLVTADGAETLASYPYLMRP